ncbi:MAG TPA: hypothetical protein VFZ08_01150 [Terriglobia bacterium]|nr:hypothetical protein [Terriglobia bacterium]
MAEHKRCDHGTRHGFAIQLGRLKLPVAQTALSLFSKRSYAVEHLHTPDCTRFFYDYF